MRLIELATAAGGALSGADAECAGVSIDTRSLKAGELFVAIPGARVDGHDFVGAAAAAGACAALVERPVDVTLPQILVQDARLALGRIGNAWRKALPVTVVGVTGSNGKTTAKEMVSAILGVHAPVLKTVGNLNNDLGVPLTLARLRPQHRYAVIEMGANHPGEIAYVAGLAAPQVALITNAGDAHLEGFGSRDGVARAKGEMIGALPADGVAVLNADDAYIGFWRGLAGERKVISFGFHETADVRGLTETVRVSHEADGFHTLFDSVIGGVRRQLALRLAGRHNVANALAAAAVATALGLPSEQIAAGLAQIEPVPGRMQPELAGNGALFINDTYNANPSSFSAALDVLLQLPGEPWIVLGAFGELGENSAALHAGLGEEARRAGVARLFATGPHAEQAVAAFGSHGRYFSEQSDLIRHLQETLDPKAVVLVKGSRAQRMERVIEAFCRGVRET